MTMGAMPRELRYQYDRYKNVMPDFVVSQTFAPRQVTLQANTPMQLIAANRPRLFLITNIDNPSNTPIFIGPNNSVTTTNGFPIVSGIRYCMGVLENTQVWGISVAQVILYILDMGL